MRTIRLQVTLREVFPPVRRVLDVPAASTLPELHELLQAGLGWTNSHLHEFIPHRSDTGSSDTGSSDTGSSDTGSSDTGSSGSGGSDAEAGHDPWAVGAVRYGIPDTDFHDLDAVRDETGAQLRDLGSRFVYLYDFGDQWTHDIEVLGPGGERPGCVYGEGTCPPEDCGGPTGHAELLAVLADPGHDDHAHLRSWAGPDVAFDQTATDALIRRTVGAVPDSVTLLLDLVADGVRLTQAGRLPRALVRAVQAHRPGWAFDDDRPAHREADLPALAALHDVLRAVGLLRLRHGVLAPTRAAGDELAAIRRLRSWFGPEEEFTSILSGTLVAVLAHHGPQPSAELARRVHPLLDRWVHRDGSALAVDDVRGEIARLSAPLRALDLIRVAYSGTIDYTAGDSAQTLLHRATGLAHLWSLPRYRHNPLDPSDEAHHNPEPFTVIRQY